MRFRRCERFCNQCLHGVRHRHANWSEIDTLFRVDEDKRAIRHARYGIAAEPQEQDEKRNTTDLLQARENATNHSVLKKVNQNGIATGESA